MCRSHEGAESNEGWCPRWTVALRRERYTPAEPPLGLGIAQVGVALDEGPCCIEEAGYFLVSHLFVNLPADLHLTLVMKSPYSPAT